MPVTTGVHSKMTAKYSCGTSKEGSVSVDRSLVWPSSAFLNYFFFIYLAKFRVASEKQQSINLDLFF